MRPVLAGDVSNAACVLLGLPQGLRKSACRRMIRQAETAERHRLRTGRAHPQFGNGSLMAAARRYRRVPEPNFDCLDYCACFQMVLTEFLARNTAPTGSARCHKKP